MKFKKPTKWTCLISIGVLLFTGFWIYKISGEGNDYGNRAQIRQMIQHNFADEADQLGKRFGVRPFVESQDPNLPNSRLPVLLIHGLDDPGKVWMNLAPALDKAGYSVWIVQYPNDQPIKESAKFIYDRIKATNVLQNTSVAIVAHSMGGLVVREMVTSPILSYDKDVGKKEFPQISQIIMVGTPNHGSKMAHLRIFAEIREQFVHVTKGEYHWLLPFVDGVGEAGVDLLPESNFLSELNGRHHPAGIKMRVIAGVMSPVEQKEMARSIEGFEDKLSDKNKIAFEKLIDNIHSIAQQVGDGAVSLKSATLLNVPLVTVAGTHLSIIRNISPDSERVPPAIPVILDTLRELQNGHQNAK